MPSKLMRQTSLKLKISLPVSVCVLKCVSGIFSIELQCQKANRTLLLLHSSPFSFLLSPLDVVWKSK